MKRNQTTARLQAIAHQLETLKKFDLQDVWQELQALQTEQKELQALEKLVRA